MNLAIEKSLNDITKKLFKKNTAKLAKFNGKYYI